MKTHTRSVQRTLYFLVMLMALCFTGNTAFCQSDSTHWWNDAVFYEVFVRSFKDSDGDGKGDLQGLMEKLDYLNDGDSTTHDDLGVTALWLMPIQQSPSYHGYDVVDYRTIEEDYGTNEDFKSLIAQAHDRGIKVIIDYVINHTSSQHAWFLESYNAASVKRDWYVWKNTSPGNTGPWGQQVWHPRNGEFNYGIFWSEMPDLNYETPAVKTEIFDIASFWLQDMDVDGFRLDAVKYIFEDGNTLEDTPETIRFWKDFRAHYKSINRDALGVGEAWTSTDKVVKYVEDSSLDYCFEFDMAEAILAAANYGDVAGLENQMDEVMSTYPFLQFGSFLTNHDMNRVMNRLGNNTAKAKIAADLLLTLPGVPYIYYGEEIGMNGAKPDENIRKPMQWDQTTQAGFTTGTPWRSVNSDYQTKNVKTQSTDTSSLLSHYRNLIALRNNQPCLRRGDFKQVASSSSSTFAFLRQYDDENIFVVTNTDFGSVSDVQVSTAGAGIIPGDYVLVDLMRGEQVPVSVNSSGDISGISISQIGGRKTIIYKLMNPSEIVSEVTFMVDMREMIVGNNFEPETETVDITGNFNEFGSTGITPLSDDDGDSIYSVSLTEMGIGTKLKYKYRLNGINDGKEEFANSSYLRQYIVQEGVNSVKDRYQQESVATGIESPTAHALNIYPLPVKDELFVQIDGYSGMCEYRLTDLTGKEQFSSTVVVDESGILRVLRNDLPSGLYVFTVLYGVNVKSCRVIFE